MAYIGIGPASFTNNLTNVQILDDISGGFDGNDKTLHDRDEVAVDDRDDDHEMLDDEDAEHVLTYLLTCLLTYFVSFLASLSQSHGHHTQA